MEIRRHLCRFSGPTHLLKDRSPRAGCLGLQFGFKHLQEWRLHSFPENHFLLSDKSHFRTKFPIFRNCICFSLRPLPLFLSGHRGEFGLVFFTFLYQVLPKNGKITLESSPGWTAPTLSLHTGQMLQSLVTCVVSHQTCSLNSLGSPEVNSELAGFLQCWVEGKDRLFQPTGNILCAAWDAAVCPGHRNTLLAFCPAGSWVLLCQAAFHPAADPLLQCVLVPGAVLPRHRALHFLGLNFMRFQPTEVPPNGSTAIWYSKSSLQICVISHLAEGVLHHPGKCLEQPIFPSRILGFAIHILFGPIFLLLPGLRQIKTYSECSSYRHNNPMLLW